MLANAQAKLVHDFESPSLRGRARACYFRVVRLNVGDLNVQKEGPGNLRLSFPPNIFWLLRKEFAEMTNLIHFFSR